MGTRKNGRARRRHARGEVSPSPFACLPRAPVLSFAHYFQAPATPAILKTSTKVESSRVSRRGLINGTGFPVILVGTAKKNILEFPSHLRNFFTRTSCSIWSLHQNSRSFWTILWWTFLLKVLSIYHKWLRTRARTYASITYKHCRVIYHSGFYLTQLLLVGCMLSLFSVVLFGIDGALVSFDSLQLVCKVSGTLQASHVVTWTPILFLYCLELLYLFFASSQTLGAGRFLWTLLGGHIMFRQHEVAV